jgi:hypothetical protein
MCHRLLDIGPCMQGSVSAAEYYGPDPLIFLGGTDAIIGRPGGLLMNQAPSGLGPTGEYP